MACAAGTEFGCCQGVSSSSTRSVLNSEHLRRRPKVAMVDGGERRLGVSIDPLSLGAATDVTRLREGSLGGEARHRRVVGWISNQWVGLSVYS